MSGYKRDRGTVLLSTEDGLAFLTVMMVMLMLTVLGITAITVSGLENNIAGMHRTTETAANAAESCLGTGVNLLQQVMLPENGSTIPAAFLDNATPPGPVPIANNNKTTLEQEIMGNPEGSIDTPADQTPNLRISVGGYTVSADIDRLFAKAKAGSGQQQNAAYDGAGVGAGANGIDIFYRIDCMAVNSATGTESRVSAVYACSMTGDGCQRQP